MIRKLLTGAKYLLVGIKLLNKRGIRRFVVLPMLINVLLFAGVIGFGTAQFSALLDRWIPERWEWLAWVIWPLFALIALAVAFFTFTIVANLLAAPFNGTLAAAVEAKITGKSYQQMKRKGILREAASVIYSELRKLLYIIFRGLPLLILFVIPVVQVTVAPFLWFLFGAWMLAVEYTDYPMGNHGMTFPQIRKTLASSRFLALGFGSAAMLMTLIPILNFLVMPAAVAGATALWVEQIKPALAER